jgi:hypothetical protein
MAVEVIVLVPLFALLWQIGNILHDVNVTAIHAFGETRSCAWRYALRGCRSIPDGCPMSTVGELDGGELEAAASGGFATIGGRLSFLKETLASRHGKLIESRRDTSVANPLWRDIPIHSAHAVMCNTPTLEWTEPDVVSSSCDALIGRWCP